MRMKTQKLFAALAAAVFFFALPVLGADGEIIDSGGGPPGSDSGSGSGGGSSTETPAPAKKDAEVGRDVFRLAGGLCILVKAYKGEFQENVFASLAECVAVAAVAYPVARAVARDVVKATPAFGALDLGVRAVKGGLKNQEQALNTIAHVVADSAIVGLLKKLLLNLVGGPATAIVGIVASELAGREIDKVLPPSKPIRRTPEMPPPTALVVEEKPPPEVVPPEGREPLQAEEDPIIAALEAAEAKEEEELASIMEAAGTAWL